jgi:hypothetical protein
MSETKTALPITFLNDDREKTMEEAGRKYLEYRKADFLNFMDGNATECGTSFRDYGLCIDNVFNDKSGRFEYVRFQLSWGGPSDELRYYPSGKIEYVYLDWFTGVGFDVTDEAWAKWSEVYAIEQINMPRSVF